MGDGVVAFMFGLGVAGWSYGKLIRRTGEGDAKTTLMACAVIFAACFLFLYSLLKWVLHV
ncbi:MAG TPA: hypothetical protein VHD60_01705 [Candidatus Saccharimonadales bacterium]|nr:hypothetical protein [Candidatus Saccharimonadales bacterium]